MTYFALKIEQESQYMYNPQHGHMHATSIVSLAVGPALTAVPEPSALVLACGGILLIGGWCRRRRA